MFNRPRTKARFEIRYVIAGREYWTTIPAISASHIWQNWDRKGAKLTSVTEIE